MSEVFIDASNSVLGRLASAVCKKLDAGDVIIIVNAEKAIITGNPKKIVAKYLETRRRGSPQHGPFFPKRPELIVGRTIRGMLPKTRKGRLLLKKVRVYTGKPHEFNDKKFENVAVKEVVSDFITIGELAKSLGWIRN
jgi:large subunit ribosomal protein L13